MRSSSRGPARLESPPVGSPAVESPNKRLVFIAGLHRSGTSLLHRCLSEHPSISGFAGTGVPEDEGQHLQTVFPAAREYGGAGLFGYSPQAHMTEASPQLTDESRRRLWREWSAHWDMTRPVLLEKSPPNLLKSRFLQALFPDSRFIVVTRHPIAVALATSKWRRRSSLQTLIEHWLLCHETFAKDAPHLRSQTSLRYEDFVASPQSMLDRLFGFLELPAHATGLEVRASINDAYFERWQRKAGSPFGGGLRRFVREVEPRANALGYSLLEPHRP